MEFMMLILNRKDSVNKAISTLSHSTVSGLTVFDSESLGQFLGENPSDESESMTPVGMRMSAAKTITAIIQDGLTINDIKEKLKTSGIDLDQPGEGELIALPVSGFAGAK